MSHPKILASVITRSRAAVKAEALSADAYNTVLVRGQRCCRYGTCYCQLSSPSATRTRRLTCAVGPGEDAERARAAVGFGVGLLDVRGKGVRRCDAA